VRHAAFVAAESDWRAGGWRAARDEHRSASRAPQRFTWSAKIRERLTERVDIPVGDLVQASCAAVTHADLEHGIAERVESSSYGDCRSH
jgi:hypothetical protein